jgi:hypothetical protein
MESFKDFIQLISVDYIAGLFKLVSTGQVEAQVACRG